MKRFLFYALITLAHSQTPCMNAAREALEDSAFDWLVSGTPAEQQTRLAAVCDPQDTTARAVFNARLAALRENCVTELNGTTSATEIVFDVLEGILCKKIDGQLCALGIFALFSAQYFFSLQSAASADPPQPAPLPQLTTLMLDPDKKAAICRSDVCNSAIEQYVSSFSRTALDNSDDAGRSQTQASIDFVTKLANRMRCGCFTNGGNTCYTSQIVDDLSDATTIKPTGCETDGNVKPCARTFMTCDAKTAPVCPGTPTCPGFSVTFDVEIRNLDKVCFFNAMTAQGSALGAIYDAMTTNLRGTIRGDFNCDCPQSNPERWVKCTCVVKCATIAMFNENQILSKINEYTVKFAANSGALDLVVPTSCKINSAITTYGETVAFRVNGLPSTGAATALSVCAPLLLALLALF